MAIINIEKLNYSYGKKEVLKELSLDIDENKLTGIIGPNGCGKSTLAKNIIKYINGKFESFKIARIFLWNSCFYLLYGEYTSNF